MPTVNPVGVQRRLFATLEQQGKTRVASITPLPTGYQIGTSTGVQRIDGEGRVLEVVRFDMSEEQLFPLVRSRNAGASAVFAGKGRPGSALLIFNELGQRLGEAEPCYPTDVLVANVGEDQQPEVIVSGGGKDLRIHRLDGSLLGRVDLGEYVTGLRAIDVDSDGMDEIVVYTYPSGKGVARFRVLGSDGVVSDWKIPADGYFSIVELDDGAGLLMHDGDAFVVRDIHGQALLRFEDPALSLEGLSHPMGLRLSDGRWFFVSDGSGYFPYYIVAIFKGTELLYSEVRSGHSRAMLPIRDGDGLAVLVGARDEIWKYTLP